MEEYEKKFWANSYTEGYDYVFVNGPPSDDYTCLICTLVAREAQQASCCGKIYCKECLEKLTTTTSNPKCPNCREHLKGKYFPDKRAIRDINHLKVSCENRGLGCEWSGEIRRVENHHDRCLHRTVLCPNQCTKIIKSMNLPQHLRTDCPNREVACTHCGQSGKFHHISIEHLEQCPDLKIDCPNKGCNEKPKRKDMKSHCQECPKEMVSCEYADLGCEHVCLREKMPQHNTQQVHTHLQLTTEELKAIHTLVKSMKSNPHKYVLKMTSFSMHKESGEEWESPPFYSFPGGYKLCLEVVAGGYGNGQGTHISVFFYLMAGKNDDILEWPMRGKFSVELLNQERDENHKQHFVSFTETRATDYNSKVSKDFAPNGYGEHLFISHKDLEEQSLSSHTQYLKDDTLYFRVSMTKMESSLKPWLAGALS